MEQQEKTLNPQESLRIIRDTIDLAKNNFRENGFHFRLWGWLVVLASVMDYYLSAIVGEPRHGLVWLAMVVIGMPSALVYEWRKGRQERVENIVHNWYGLIWMGFGISTAIVIALTVQARITPVPFILVMVGFATFMSGILLRFKPLVIGAAVMWAGALVCLALSPDQHLLVQAGAAVLGYLVPGYMLNRKSDRHV